MTGGPGPGPRLARALPSILMGLAAVACGAPPPGEAGPPALPPGVRAFRHEETYPVEGTSRPALIRSLRSRGPVSRGRRWEGQHRWTLTWRFRYQPGRQGCEITDATVELESITTLPRWLDRERADSALVAEWESFLAALRVHENGHRDIAYQAARAVHRTLRRMTAPTCGGLSARANTEARKTLDRYKGEDAAYDEATRHGVTQGAVWTVPAKGGG